LKVFVAGATGSLGSLVVADLVGRGHTVVGLTRSPSRRGLVESLGAVPAVADALDAQALNEVLAAARPEAVLMLLTALPRNGPARSSQLRATNILRRHGTANLLAAAASAGARRVVGESMIFVYGYGDHGASLLDESHATATGSMADASTDALADMEHQILQATDAGHLEGIVLRIGVLGGPDAPTTRSMARLAKRRMLAIPGDGDGIHSWVDVLDAARATVLALERGRTGATYNIVDDEPVVLGDYLRELARLVDARPPRRAPLWLLRLLAPYAATFASTRLAVSNAAAKRELGWCLQRPTYRESLAALASAVVPEP
jgi:nucleoside-diphosphate-sugar epimerase